MRGAAVIRWAGAFGLSLGLTLVLARPLAAQASVTIPVVTTTAGGRQTINLEALLYKPRGLGPFPVVIYNHGSAGSDPHRSLTFTKQADYFTSRGFVVVVPMRRGRGKSGGVSLESEDKNCDVDSWAVGLRAAFEDVTAAIAYVDGLRFVDRTGIVLAGESRGGFLAVAYAAEGSERSLVHGVINFVGGWVAQAEDQCPKDFNQLAFSRFGRETKLPMVWIYGARDPYYSSVSVQAYASAFRDVGGRARFVLLDGTPRNGHALPEYPALWSSIADEYLASIGLLHHP